MNNGLEQIEKEGPDTKLSECLDNVGTYENFEIDGEVVLCRRIQNVLQEYEHAFLTADLYRKTAIVLARQATTREKISTSQDWMENYADPGDRIIQNPGDKDPYVFGNKKDSLEKRNAEFIKKYESIEDQPNKFRAKGIIKAVQVKENIVFDTAWWETMWVKAGWWVADGGYSIAESSFKNTYEKFNPKFENRKKSNALKQSL